AVLGATNGIGLGTHQRLHERSDHLPEQIRAGLTQLLSQPAGQVDTGDSGHRMLLAREPWSDLGKDHAVAVSHQTATPYRAKSNTTSVDATPDRVLRGADRAWVRWGEEFS